MRNIFTLVGVRGFNVNDSGYNLSSMSRGYGTMNYWVRELVKKNNIILHSVSMSAVLLPHTLGGGAAGADIHIAATIRLYILSPRLHILSPRLHILSPRPHILSPRPHILSPRLHILSPRLRKGVRAQQHLIHPPPLTHPELLRPYPFPLLLFVVGLVVLTHRHSSTVPRRTL